MTKILLVEDDKSLREIYGVRLMAEGYEIVSAGDGEEALAMAIKERPGLIVSDVMMPKISGFDMLDILRSTTETKDVKVIMMTALSSEDQRARGEALGADRYLVKSQVGIEDVVRTVHDVLGDGVAAPTPAPSFPAFTSPVAPAPVVAAPAPAPAAVAPQPVAESAPQVAPVQPEVPAAPVYEAPVPAPEVAPVAAPAPVAPEAPAPAPAPVYEAPAPVAPAPSTPPAPAYEAPAPTPEPAPAPVEAPQPFAMPTPTPAPAPQESSALPQPTAPFSTNRPASLGDRVINPLPSADSLTQSTGDIASQMNQELNAGTQPPQPPVPPAPGI